MERILKVGKSEIILDPTIEQISPLGRPFRLSGIKLDLTVKPIYKDKMYKHPTIITFRYTDEQDGFFRLYFDAHDKFSHKL